MKCTKMRNQGKVLSTDLILMIRNELRQKFEYAGFITNVEVITRSSLKIDLHMRTFSIDTVKHGRNLHHSPCGNKLTNLPTWDQRVEFNDIVNHVLNKFNVSANVKSGPFTIREGMKCMVENDWQDQKPEYLNHNENRGYYIAVVDEETYLDNKRMERNKLAKERRLQKKIDESKLSQVKAM